MVVAKDVVRTETARLGKQLDELKGLVQKQNGKLDAILTAQNSKKS